MTKKRNQTMNIVDAKQLLIRYGFDVTSKAILLRGYATQRYTVSRGTDFYASSVSKGVVIQFAYCVQVGQTIPD